MKRLGVHGHVAVALSALLLFTACTQTTQDRATASPPQPSTPSPPGFPDMSHFSAADYNRYGVVNTPQVQGFAFTTPDGLHCSNNAYPTPDSEWVRCWGPRPDKGPGVWSIRAERDARAVVEQLAPNPDFDASSHAAPPVLPASTRITAVNGESTCGVGNDGVTACRIGDHGFVLSPTSTQVF